MAAMLPIIDVVWSIIVGVVHFVGYTEMLKFHLFFSRSDNVSKEKLVIENRTTTTTTKTKRKTHRNRWRMDRWMDGWIHGWVVVEKIRFGFLVFQLPTISVGR